MCQKKTTYALKFCVPIIDTLSSVGIQVKAPPHILLRPAPPLRLFSMLRAGSPWLATGCAEVATERVRRMHRNHLAGAEPNAHVSDEAKGPLSMTPQHMTFLSSPIAMVMLPPQLTCVACRRLSRFLCVPHTSTCDVHVSIASTSRVQSKRARQAGRGNRGEQIRRISMPQLSSAPLPPRINMARDRDSS